MPRIATALITTLLLLPTLALAETAFVVDRLVVAVRKDKGFNSPVVGRVTSLDQVELTARDGKWSKVKIEDGTEGWMPGRYLVTEPPKALRLAELEQKNADLESRITELTDENAQLSGRLTDLAQQAESRPSQSQADLDKMAAVEVELSGEMAELKDRYDSAKAELDRLRKEAESLRKTADAGLSGRRLKWFIAGGAVLLGGWLAGLLVGRRRRSGNRLF